MLKGLIQDRLDFGDCAEYVARLINQAWGLTEGTNAPKPAESFDVMHLFEKIRSQPNGGVL
jgi:hypothetical protein